jgi:hypothetical protein
VSERPGRLSSIDLVPDEGREDVAWALGQLVERSKPQGDVLFELNGRLAMKGIAPISRSAFSRRAVRLFTQRGRAQEMRELFADLAPQFSPDNLDKGNLVLGELIKTLISELLDAGADGVNTTGALELARAFKATIEGQALSVELRRQIERDFAERADKAISAVAQKRGLSADLVGDIRAQILGVKE